MGGRERSEQQADGVDDDEEVCDQQTSNKKSCFQCAVMDRVGEAFTIANLVAVTGIMAHAFLTTTSTVGYVALGVVCALGVVEVRIRRLGEAASIAESIEVFREQNHALARSNRELRASVSALDQQVDELGTQVTKQDQVAGLLDGSVENIDEARAKLLDLHGQYERTYERYRAENDRMAANNLLTLFNLVDVDGDGTLSKEQQDRLSTYARTVFEIDFDFAQLDANHDGSISMDEFFRKFRQTRRATT